MNEHVKTLSRRHREVDAKLQQELQRPAPDSIAVRTLKKLKLGLKDKMEAILAGTNYRSQHPLRAGFRRNNVLHQVDPYFPHKRRC